MTHEDILALQDLEVKEGLRIEYKERLPGETESDRKEFLADVSSFASAAGGDLLYGVRGKRAEEAKSTGIPEQFSRLREINLQILLHQGKTPDARESLRRAPGAVLGSLLDHGLSP